MTDTHDQSGASIHRRVALKLGALSAVALLGGATSASAGSGGVKLTVLYTKQKDPDAFNTYYFGKHLPLAEKVPGLQRIEVATILPNSPGEPEPPYWRIAELYFPSADDLQKGFASEVGKATAADLDNFVDKGTYTIFASTIGT